MRRGALPATALLLCGGIVSGVAWRVTRPRNAAIRANDPAFAVASASKGADFLGTAASPCPPDRCSLATVRALIAIELDAAAQGTQSRDRAVRAIAARIEGDFREDGANLDALESRLAVPEAPCAVTERAKADVESALASDAGDSSASFVSSQRAALGEIKRILNSELIGCAANGDLKTSLRFVRLRLGDAGADARGGVLADLESFRALEPDSGAPSTFAPRPPAFLHPGILVTRAQLDFVKKEIALGAEPWASAFARARADLRGSLAYRPRPPWRSNATDTTPSTDDGLVLCGSFSDPDVHCTDEKEDSVAAYTQALLWYLSGDERYARNTIAILDAWSVLEDHRLFNAALEAGWTGTMFARAAELMQVSPLWPAADVTRFKAMVSRAFLPRLLAARPGVAPVGDASYGQNGNWVLSIADSLIQLGVLLDDRETYDRGIALWRDRVPAYCYLASRDGAHPRLPAGGHGGSNAGFAEPATRTGDPDGFWGQAARTLADGTSQETCRDLEHVQFGLAALLNGAETARIQGLDLYEEESARIGACMELAARYENEAPGDRSGHPLSYATPVNPAVGVPGDPSVCPNLEGRPVVTLLNTGSLATYAVQPTWEIGYNALANRLRIPLPQTRELVVRYRNPAPGWVGATHHIARETLTHGDLGSVGLPAVSVARVQ